MANKMKVVITKIGEAKVDYTVNGEKFTAELPEACHVEGLRAGECNCILALQAVNKPLFEKLIDKLSVLDLRYSRSDIHAGNKELKAKLTSIHAIAGAVTDLTARAIIINNNINDFKGGVLTFTSGANRSRLDMIRHVFKPSYKCNDGRLQKNVYGLPEFKLTETGKASYKTEAIFKNEAIYTDMKTGKRKKVSSGKTKS